MKIRHIILVLTGGLGFALILVALILLQEELASLDTARRLQASNSVREELLVASTALSRERTKTYIQLIRPDGTDLAEPLRMIRMQADHALLRARDELEASRLHLPETPQKLASLNQTQAEIAALRASVDKLISGEEPDYSGKAAGSWLVQATGLVGDLQASRLDLLQNNRPVDPVLSAEANFRSFVNVLNEAVAFNEAIGIALLATTGGQRKQHERTLQHVIGRMDLAWQLIENENSTPLAPDVRSGISAAGEFFRQTYAPLQRDLFNAATAPSREGDMEAWTETSEAGLAILSDLQTVLLNSSRSRLELLVTEAQRSAVFVGLVAVAGALAAILILRVVRRRVINPIGTVTEAMVRLAANDLSTPAPRARRQDELGLMTDALRTFKANAIIRQRTQGELQRLHLDLQETYDRLRHDLEAAATIQIAMLPVPATVDHVSHTGLYLPSALIAGDTYNVIRRPNGAVGFFQIDVAGHGAAAALVSVAGQHTLSQAILTRQQDVLLEDIVAEINRQWPPELPYFTTILGEIDPDRPLGRIVQAGHPSPLLIRADGAVYFLGESGFPIGVLQQASYDSIEFGFDAGDRLLIYSDGVIETENLIGEFYSEDRLRALVTEHADRPTSKILQVLEASLRNWRGRDSLTDDVSVLVVERISSWNPANAIH